MSQKIEPDTLDRLKELIEDAINFQREARVTIFEVKKFLSEDGGNNHDNNQPAHNSTQCQLSQVVYNSSQSSSDRANSNVGATTTSSSIDMPRTSVDKSLSSVGNISKALSTRYPITRQYSRFMSTPRYPLKNTK